MYKVVLYSEGITTGEFKKITVESDKVPEIDEEGRLNFYDAENNQIFQFNRGSWQYWKKETYYKKVK